MGQAWVLPQQLSEKSRAGARSSDDDDWAIQQWAERRRHACMVVGRFPERDRLAAELSDAVPRRSAQPRFSARPLGCNRCDIDGAWMREASLL